MASVTALQSLDAGTTVGFMTPLIKISQQSGWFVQRAEMQDDKILKFIPFDVGPTQLMTLASPQPVKIGESQIYAFRHENGVYVGAKSHIANCLRNYAASNPTRVAVLLQIAALIGTTAEVQKARARFMTHLSTEFGQRAAAFFEHSSINASLRVELEKQVKPITDAEIFASIARDSRFATIDAQYRAQFPGDLSVELSEKLENIAESILKNYDTAVVTSDQFSVNLELGLLTTPINEFPSIPIPDLHQRIAKIRLRPRQEERVAMLIADLIGSADLTYDLLDNFSPYAAFEVSAVELLRTAFAGTNYDSLNRELTVAKLVPRLFRSAYPLNRGHVLYYLSLHLAQYNSVNQAIRLTLSNTSSVFVHNFYKDILLNLQRV